eukprot:668276-Pleurochrysis_carterae.AAC.14
MVKVLPAPVWPYLHQGRRAGETMGKRMQKHTRLRTHAPAHSHARAIAYKREHTDTCAPPHSHAQMQACSHGRT